MIVCMIRAIALTVLAVSSAAFSQDLTEYYSTSGMDRFRTRFSGPIDDAACLWDTGSPESIVINPDYAQKLLEQDPDGENAKAKGSLQLTLESNGGTVAQSFRYKGFVVKDPEAYRGIDLLIGGDFLSQRIVRFNYLAKQVTLLGEFDSVDQEGFTAFSFDLFFGVPVVDVEYNGTWARACIDTGLDDFAVELEQTQDAVVGYVVSSGNSQTILPISLRLGARCFDQGILVLDYRHRTGYWKRTTDTPVPHQDLDHRTPFYGETRRGPHFL